MVVVWRYKMLVNGGVTQLNKVIDYYNAFDEWGRLDREPVEFVVNLHHILSMLCLRKVTCWITERDLGSIRWN